MTASYPPIVLADAALTGYALRRVRGRRGQPFRSALRPMVDFSRANYVQSAALLAAIKEYESSKWKVIGQKVGKPAKVPCIQGRVDRPMTYHSSRLVNNMRKSILAQRVSRTRLLPVHSPSGTSDTRLEAASTQAQVAARPRCHIERTLRRRKSHHHVHKHSQRTLIPAHYTHPILHHNSWLIPVGSGFWRSEWFTAHTRLSGPPSCNGE